MVYQFVVFLSDIYQLNNVKVNLQKAYYKDNGLIKMDLTVKNMYGQTINAEAGRSTAIIKVLLLETWSVNCNFGE